MTLLLDSLNPDQQKAVTHTGSPLLILAGAGSGKTRALTYRAAHLIKNQGIDPSRILLTTFTNKAAQEMQERLQHLVGLRLPFAGTFHSLSARLLRRHAYQAGFDPAFVIFDPTDQQAVIKQALNDLNIDSKEVKPKSVLIGIEQAKQELLTPGEYEQYARGPYQKMVAAVYHRYQKLLKKFNALDFSDLLTEMVTLFQTNNSLLSQYQERFLHVLVDEYQDTNKAQYQLTKLLSGKHKNLCVVGDASQAIYSWRGADYRNLLLLKQDYPDLTTIKLEQNYRSTQNILDAAYGVIAYNRSHPILSLWTEKTGGDLVKIYKAKDEYDEANFILKTIRSQSLPLSDFAVLYRTNAQSRVLEEVFIRQGIPYILVGGVKFYERKEVKDVLSYVRYVLNPNDDVAKDRLVKLGKRRLAQVDAWAKSLDRDLPPLAILDQVISVSDYLSRFDKNDPEDLARIENVQELRSVAQNFSTVVEFLENVALVEQDTKKSGWVMPQASVGKSQDSIVLMTLHSSKGLEFSQVFMIGMEEALFPHSRALMSKDELEEERRLCYVGMTRAQEKLYLTYADRRLYFGAVNQNQVSRFIEEIPPEVVQSPPPESSTPAGTVKIDDAALDRFLNDEIDIDEFLNS